MSQRVTTSVARTDWTAPRSISASPYPRGMVPKRRTVQIGHFDTRSSSKTAYINALTCWISKELLSGKAIPPTSPSGHKWWNVSPWEGKDYWKFFPSCPFHLLMVLCCFEVDQIISNRVEWVCSERRPHWESPWGFQEMCLPVSYASVGSAPRKFKSSCHKPWKRKCAAKKGWMKETYKGCG